MKPLVNQVNFLELKDKLADLLGLKIRIDLCLLCDELYDVDIMVISDLYAGFIRHECSSCGCIVRAENIVPVGDAERKEWGMDPLSARHKWGLRVIRAQLPDIASLISWV